MPSDHTHALLMLLPFRLQAAHFVFQHQFLQQTHPTVSKVKGQISTLQCDFTITSIFFSLSSAFFFLLSGIRSSNQVSSFFVKHRSRSFRMKTRARTCREQPRVQIFKMIQHFGVGLLVRAQMFWTNQPSISYQCLSTLGVEPMSAVFTWRRGYTFSRSLLLNHFIATKRHNQTAGQFGVSIKSDMHVFRLLETNHISSTEWKLISLNWLKINKVKQEMTMFIKELSSAKNT